MSNPNNGLGRDEVPKVLQVKIRKTRSGGENNLGNSLKNDLVLTLEEAVSQFLFAVELKWEGIPGPGYETISVPSTIQPVIENESGTQVTEGKCVAFIGLDEEFPQGRDTITVQLGHVSATSSSEPILPQPDVSYRYEGN